MENLAGGGTAQGGRRGAGHLNQSTRARRAERASRGVLQDERVDPETRQVFRNPNPPTTERMKGVGDLSPPRRLFGAMRLD